MSALCTTWSTCGAVACCAMLSTQQQQQTCLQLSKPFVQTSHIGRAPMNERMITPTQPEPAAEGHAKQLLAQVLQQCALPGTEMITAERALHVDVLHQQGAHEQAHDHAHAARPARGFLRGLVGARRCT